MPKKFSLNDAIKIAEFHGGKCLSKEYINCEIPMLWECSEYHQWMCSFRSIKNRHSWCPYCSNRKLNISVAKELACAKNGWCISENYVNINSPLLWECENSHRFLLSLSNVKNGKNWCRECMKLGLEFAQNLANKRGGTCLSSSYHNRRTPLSWKCFKGHSWFARIDSIQRGTWCPHCVGKSEKLDIEYAKELARSRNGECLSDVYINYTTHLHWRCSKSHEWLASLNGIKNKNYWCPYCASTKLDISVAKAIAYSREGGCLTDSYTNCKSQLLWRCNKNHQWYATLSHIKNDNTWCPYCSKYKRKRLCRELCQNILDRHLRYVDLIFLKL